MKFTIEQVNHVVALEQHRHFGRAADQLGITQPALSRSIQALEARLGGRLFQRSRSGVHLTPLGLRFLERGRDILESAARLEGAMDEEAGRAGLELTFACGLYPAELSLVPALGRLQKEEPGLVVQSEITDWSRSQYLLDNRKIQFALSELEESVSRTVRPLNRQPLRIVVRSGHPLARVKAPDWSTVLSCPWVSPVIPPRGAVHFSGAKHAGKTDEATGRFIPAMVTPSLSAMLKLILNTDMVGLLPLVLVEEQIERRDAALVRFHAPWLRLGYGLAWQAGQVFSPLVRRFMSLLVEEEDRLQQRERALAARYGCDEWPMSP